MTIETRASLRLPLRATRLATVRDLAMVAVCIALVATFLADVWRSVPPQAFRRLDPSTDVRKVA
jgi:hypothetical protein